MLKQHPEFVFIMLKPAAANDKNLTKLIYQKLLVYGDIKHLKELVVVDRKRIAEHYKGSKSSFWYPLLINYLSNKTVEYFVLELNHNKYRIFTENNGNAFADFLKKEVIGPANLFKTKEYHIRRLALSKSSVFLLDNLIHCSSNTKEALDEIRIWYKDYPIVIEEFETKALALLQNC